MRWVIVLLFIIGCAEKNPQLEIEYEYRIDPRLQYYVDDFYSEAKKRNLFLKKENLIVEIADIPDSLGAIGITTIKGITAQRIVRIDSVHYHRNKYKFYAMENLMFHELGHALLNRQHNNHYSIMNTFAPESIFIHDEKLRKLLLHELFYGDTVNIWKK